MLQKPVCGRYVHMSDSYERFLRRMIQYRDQMKMSQQEVGGLFGKTQSQLSKMELGKILFSYQILESLLNDGNNAFGLTAFWVHLGYAQRAANLDSKYFSDIVTSACSAIPPTVRSWCQPFSYAIME